MLRYLKLTAFLISLLVLNACSPSRSITEKEKKDLPSVQKEFRAAWVATVANINWPSKPGLPVDSQQREAIQLLDFLQEHNFNAVILQVRPQADALYKSDLEPWSYYLTGVQGKAPEPFYDPLSFWIDAAHERGLELHVWLNPYRAHHISGGEVSENSIVKRKPELVMKLKEGYWWFDPALQGTKDHSTAVVMDIVRRYDIDGVHFDDYFYPYPSYNKNEDFPDQQSWEAYQRSGGKLSRGDWRRDAVNSFIKSLYSKIKAEKKHVKFGLSPFGIWRPGFPESISGFDQYDVLYADAKLWLNEGWIDYFTPQLYWPINRISQSFPVLLGWWEGENTKSRHLWPGMSVGRDTSSRSVNETINQIMITRGMLPQSMGAVHWSISSVTMNPRLAKALLDGPYKTRALVPSSPWLDDIAPVSPDAHSEVIDDSLRLTWNHPDENDIFHWIVYYKLGNNWNYRILENKKHSVNLPRVSIATNGQTLLVNEILVAAADRVGNVSIPKNVSFTAFVPGEDLLPFAIIPRSGWNASEPRPYKSHEPVRITIHHEGTRLELKDDAVRKIKNIQTWGMGPDRNWVDLPYHFMIAPDGRIFEGRNLKTVGETATEYDPTGHLLISCMGNLNEQPVTKAQLASLVNLVAYCCRKYQISPETIASHKDYSTQTTCPGKNLYLYLENGYIKNRVKELLSANKQ